MSGRASITVRSRSSEPSKSGMRTSMPMPGLVSRIRVIVSAKIRDPPSGRSSRATLVTTTCSSPSVADGLRHPPRLIVVEPGRAAGLDRAEAAGPGAGVAQDHDRGRALVPALPDVRAAGLLADRVERQAAEQALELVVVLARRHPRADPVGVAAQRRRAVGRRQARQAAAHRDRSAGRAGWCAAAGRSRRTRTSGARGPWAECSTARPLRRPRATGASKPTRTALETRSPSCSRSEQVPLR